MTPPNERGQYKQNVRRNLLKGKIKWFRINSIKLQEHEKGIRRIFLVLRGYED